MRKHKADITTTDFTDIFKIGESYIDFHTNKHCNFKWTLTIAAVTQGKVNKLNSTVSIKDI